MTSSSGMATPDKTAGIKLMRMYFPRTYQELIQHDFIVFEHMFMDFLTPGQIDDLARSIEIEGLGGYVAIGGVTNQGLVPNFGWINSRLSEIFPSKASEEIFDQWRVYPFGRGGRIKINEDPYLAPVLKMFIPLGMDNIRVTHSYLMIAKEGAKIWARSIDGKDDPPFLISWTCGKAETWSNNIGMTYAWWFFRDPNMGGNPFALDVFMNMLHYSMGTDMPSDILLVHAARKAFMDYEDTKASLFTLADFADRFGANMNVIYDEIRDADMVRDRGREAYLAQQYDGSLDLLREAKEMLLATVEHAIRLKNRALLWTYVIEWFVVLSTLIISGEFIYIVMVQRRLFREAARTRLAR